MLKGGADRKLLRFKINLAAHQFVVLLYINPFFPRVDTAQSRECVVMLQNFSVGAVPADLMPKYAAPIGLAY